MWRLRHTSVALSGIKNADENELRSIASDPDQIHMYNVNDFKFLVDIVDDVTNNLCNSVKGPGTRVRLVLGRQAGGPGSGCCTRPTSSGTKRSPVRVHGGKYFDVPDRAPSSDLPGGEVAAPSDLVTFDQTHHSFQVSWTEPDSPPEKFLLTFARTAGGDVQEVKYQHSKHERNESVSLI